MSRFDYAYLSINNFWATRENNDFLMCLQRMPEAVHSALYSEGYLMKNKHPKQNTPQSLYNTVAGTKSKNHFGWTFMLYPNKRLKLYENKMYWLYRKLTTNGHYLYNLCIFVWVQHIYLLAKQPCCVQTKMYYTDIYPIQSNLNSSNTDGSFTMAVSNSFSSPYEMLPIAPENKYLRKFSYFIIK